MAHGAITSGVWAHANNAAVTPTNPTQGSGDTLLCVALVRSITATLAVSGTGWTDADGITNPVTSASGGRLYLFQNENDGAGNPTVTPTGGATGVTVSAGVFNLVSRDKAQNFVLGTVGTNAATATLIQLPQDSPSIDVGNAIIALGHKPDDWTASPTLSAQAAGLTWTSLVRESTLQGSDQSIVADYAINDTGSAYTAGTGARWTGTWSGNVASASVYLESIGATTGITAGLSVTEANDSVASASAVSIAAALAKTEAGDTVSSAATVALKASASITEAADSVVSTAAIAIAGTFAVTEAGDTLSSTAALALKATFAVTEAGDTVSAAGNSSNNASLAATEANDSLSATGALPLAATVSVAEAGDTISAAAQLALKASANIVEAGDTSSSTATLAIRGSGSSTEADDTLNASAVLPIAGLLAATEGDDTIAATSSFGRNSGQLDATEDDDILSASGGRRSSRRTINPHTRNSYARPATQTNDRPQQAANARPTSARALRPANISRGTR